MFMASIDAMLLPLQFLINMGSATIDGDSMASLDGSQVQYPNSTPKPLL